MSKSKHLEKQMDRSALNVNCIGHNYDLKGILIKVTHITP